MFWKMRRAGLEIDGLTGAVTEAVTGAVTEAVTEAVIGGVIVVLLLESPMRPILLLVFAILIYVVPDSIESVIFCNLDYTMETP